MQDTASKPVVQKSRTRSRYHDVRRAIKALNLPRACRNVLVAILSLGSAETLSTEAYPVSLSKLAEEAAYSRAHVAATLNELEITGYVERIRNRYKREDGTWWNAPTTYVLHIPDVEAAEPSPTTTSAEPTKAQERPASASQPSSPPLVKLSAPQKPQEPAKPVQAPIKAVDAPQEASGFSEYEIALGLRIQTTAYDLLSHHIEKPEHALACATAWKGVVTTRYSLAGKALYAMTDYLIAEREIHECIHEWVKKCVLANPCQSHLQSAARLANFFRAKGKAIEGVRRKTMGVA